MSYDPLSRRARELANIARTRYFPYYMTVASLTIIFILGLFWLIAQRRLLPAIVMIGAFILFVLWLTGLIIVAIELFGPSGSISSNCDIEVFSRNPKGQTIEVLAFLQQKNICESLITTLANEVDVDCDRRVLAAGVRYGADRSSVPAVDHDHGVPGLRRFVVHVGQGWIPSFVTKTTLPNRGGGLVPPCRGGIAGGT